MRDFTRFEPPAFPWTKHYGRLHASLVAAALKSEELGARVAAGVDPPPGYGIGFDERVIEYPWVFGHLLAGNILDAGSALNHEHLLGHLPAAIEQLDIVTLAPESRTSRNRRVNYYYQDLRELSFPDDAYDVAISISTLEHVGMDNRRYGDDSKRSDDVSAASLQAVAELARVVRPAGLVLITVPFGRREGHGWFRQLDAADLTDLFGGQALERFRVAIFRLSPSGWVASSPAEAAGCHYRDYVNDQAPASDLAAAARAVACVSARVAQPGKVVRPFDLSLAGIERHPSDPSEATRRVRIARTTHERGSLPVPQFGPIPLIRLCTLEDFADPSLRAFIRDIEMPDAQERGPLFPSGHEYYPHWMSGMAAHALARLGELHDSNEVLSVGRGRHSLRFWLTRHVRRVFAAAPIDRPDKRTPHETYAAPWRPERLELLEGDVRHLGLPSSRFNVVDCLALSDLHDVTSMRSTLEEVCRVLKPEGHAVVGVGFGLAGPFEELTSPSLLDRAAVMELFDGLPWSMAAPLDTRASDVTLATAVDVAVIAEEIADYGEIRSFPHLVMSAGGIVWTVLHLVVRKDAA